MKPGLRAFSGCSLHAYTILELTVVVAVLAILVSLVLPGVARSRNSSQAMVCARNLRTIGKALEMYTGENNTLLPFGGIAFSQVSPADNAASVYAGYGGKTGAGLINARVTWDDLLARYMGINLSPDEILAAYMPLNKSNPAMICPGDIEFNTHPAYNPRIVRSYAVNRNRHTQIGTMSGPEKVWGLFDYLNLNPGTQLLDQTRTGRVQTFRWSDISVPASTLAVMEQWNGVSNLNLQGSGASGCVNNPSDQFAGHGSTHHIPRDLKFLHEGLSNYLFADGHVDKLQPAKTAGPPWSDSPENWYINPYGMWLRLR